MVRVVLVAQQKEVKNNGGDTQQPGLLDVRLPAHQGRAAELQLAPAVVVGHVWRVGQAEEVRQRPPSAIRTGQLPLLRPLLRGDFFRPADCDAIRRWQRLLPLLPLELSSLGDGSDDARPNVRSCPGRRLDRPQLADGVGNHRPPVSERADVRGRGVRDDGQVALLERRGVGVLTAQTPKLTQCLQSQNEVNSLHLDTVRSAAAKSGHHVTDCDSNGSFQNLLHPRQVGHQAAGVRGGLPGTWTFKGATFQKLWRICRPGVAAAL